MVVDVVVVVVVVVVVALVVVISATSSTISFFFFFGVDNGEDIVVVQLLMNISCSIQSDRKKHTFLYARVLVGFAVIHSVKSLHIYCLCLLSWLQHRAVWTPIVCPYPYHPARTRCFTQSEWDF